jgi:hypothetical protein
MLFPFRFIRTSRAFYLLPEVAWFNALTGASRDQPQPDKSAFG